MSRGQVLERGTARAGTTVESAELLRVPLPGIDIKEEKLLHQIRSATSPEGQKLLEQMLINPEISNAVYGGKSTVEHLADLAAKDIDPRRKSEVIASTLKNILNLGLTHQGDADTCVASAFLRIESERDPALYAAMVATDKAGVLHSSLAGQLGRDLAQYVAESSVMKIMSPGYNHLDDTTYAIGEKYQGLHDFEIAGGFRRMQRTLDPSLRGDLFVADDPAQFLAAVNASGRPAYASMWWNAGDHGAHAVAILPQKEKDRVHIVSTLNPNDLDYRNDRWTHEGNGVWSASLKDFNKVCRTIFIDETVAKQHGLTRLLDGEGNYIESALAKIPKAPPAIARAYRITRVEDPHVSQIEKTPEHWRILTKEETSAKVKDLADGGNTADPNEAREMKEIGEAARAWKRRQEEWQAQAGAEEDQRRKRRSS